MGVLIQPNTKGQDCFCTYPNKLHCSMEKPNFTVPHFLYIWGDFPPISLTLKQSPFRDVLHPLPPLESTATQKIVGTPTVPATRHWRQHCCAVAMLLLSCCTVTLAWQEEEEERKIPALRATRGCLFAEQLTSEKRKRFTWFSFHLPLVSTSPAHETLSFQLVLSHSCWITKLSCSDLQLQPLSGTRFSLITFPAQLNRCRHSS